MSVPVQNQTEEKKKKFKIVSVVPVPTMNPFEEAEKEYMVLIELWDGTPLTLRVKESELNPEKIKELVKKELEKTEKLVGVELEL